MHTHPAIAALRSDPARQRCANAAIEAAHREWLDGERTRTIRRELAVFDADGDIQSSPCLAALLSDIALASNWVSGFVSSHIEALRKSPLATVPLRHSSNNGFSRLVLLRHGGTMLSLCTYEPIADPRAPSTARFADRYAHELVLAGQATAMLHTPVRGADGGAKVRVADQSWRAGTQVALQPLREARHIVKVERTMLLLQLHRATPNASPTYEHRIADGALIGQSSGDKRASEQVMALAVLGALQHRQGIGEMSEFARDNGRDPDARWEAVRQVLSLDSARGFDLLTGIATRPQDPLSANAQALRDQLLKTYPQLAQPMQEAC